MGVVHGIAKTVSEAEAKKLVKQIVKSSQLWRKDPAKIKADIKRFKEKDNDKER